MEIVKFDGGYKFTFTEGELVITACANHVIEAKKIVLDYISEKINEQIDRQMKD